MHYDILINFLLHSCRIDMSSIYFLLHANYINREYIILSKQASHFTQFNCLSVIYLTMSYMSPVDTLRDELLI